MSQRIHRFLAEENPPTPCLVMDLDLVRQNYEALQAALPTASIFYAMKANPAPEIWNEARDEALTLLRAAEEGGPPDTALRL